MQKACPVNPEKKRKKVYGDQAFQTVKLATAKYESAKADGLLATKSVQVPEHPTHELNTFPAQSPQNLLLHQLHRTEITRVERAYVKSKMI